MRVKPRPIPVHTLRVVLHDIVPEVWRRVAVPSSLRLGQLHEVLHTAMGWRSARRHQFVTGETCPGGGGRVFISFAPPFGGIDEVEGEDEDQVTLAEVCPKSGDTLDYDFDLLSGWQHLVTVEAIGEARPGLTYPQCLDGARACPPDGCGGPPGYRRMLQGGGDGRPPGFQPEAFNLGQVNLDLEDWRVWADCRR